MSSRERRLDQGKRRGRYLLTGLADELREARIRAGLTQKCLADAVDCSQSRISAVERGVAVHLSIVEAARLASVLGLDLSVRVYPGGPPLRDAAHVALLQRFRGRVSADFRWQLEVALPVPGDQRGIDAVLSKGSERLGVEAEVRLRDIQAVVRRMELKQRDARLDRMVLLLPGTRSNRLAVREAGASLTAAFPVATRDVLAELSAGRFPPANGLVLL